MRESALEDDKSAYVVTLDGYQPTNPDALSHWLKQVGRDVGIADAAPPPSHVGHDDAQMELIRRCPDFRSMGPQIGSAHVATKCRTALLRGYRARGELHILRFRLETCRLGNYSGQYVPGGIRVASEISTTVEAVSGIGSVRQDIGTYKPSRFGISIEHWL